MIHITEPAPPKAVPPPPAPRRRMTDEESDRIMAEIARGRIDILRKRSRLRFYILERRRFIGACRARGVTLTAIARFLGRHHNSVVFQARKLP